ncbi:MAG: hypothetical protein OEV28_08485 [Nitrospirota bacterium]|nr:hypothetical protein [Nitrospirota bacterium]
MKRHIEFISMAFIVFLVPFVVSCSNIQNEIITIDNEYELLSKAYRTLNESEKGYLIAGVFTYKSINVDVKGRTVGQIIEIGRKATESAILKGGAIDEKHFFTISKESLGSLYAYLKETKLKSKIDSIVPALFKQKYGHPPSGPVCKIEEISKTGRYKIYYEATDGNCFDFSRTNFIASRFSDETMVVSLQELGLSKELEQCKLFWED